MREDFHLSERCEPQAGQQPAKQEAEPEFVSIYPTIREVGFDLAGGPLSPNSKRRDRN